MRSFWVADLSIGGEILFKEPYENAVLERVPGAAELIGEVAGRLYRWPDGFDVDLLAGTIRILWRPCCDSGGVLTIRYRDEVGPAAPWQLASFALLLSGTNEDEDRAICSAAQNRLVEILHDTGMEPAFDLAELTERPLVASFSNTLPADARLRETLAISDRCFGAAYFRWRHLV